MKVVHFSWGIPLNLSIPIYHSHMILLLFFFSLFVQIPSFVDNASCLFSCGTRLILQSTVSIPNKVVIPIKFVVCLFGNHHMKWFPKHNTENKKKKSFVYLNLVNEASETVKRRLHGHRRRSPVTCHSLPPRVFKFTSKFHSLYLCSFYIDFLL